MAQFGAANAVYPFGGEARMKAGDMDGDGDQDLFGVFNNMHLKWFENTDGAGTFDVAQALASYSDGCPGIELTDVDGDQDPDLILVGQDDDGVEVVLNDGSGAFGFPGPFLQTPGETEALAVADINGDGFSDILVTLWFPEGAGLGWFPGTADGFGPLNLFPALYSGAPSNLLLVADLDLVGGLDVILSTDNDELILARNVTGDGTSWEVQPLPIPLGPTAYPYRSPQVIDVDGDGDLDLAESRGPSVHWLRNDLDEGGVLTFEENVIEAWNTSGNGMFSASPCGLGAAVVFVPQNPALPVAWNSYLPELNGYAYSQPIPSLPRAARILLTDLNGDGKDDLVASLENGVSWFANTIDPASGSLELPVLDTLCVSGPPVALPDASPAGGAWYGWQISNNLLFRGNIGVTTDHPMVHAVYADQGCPMAQATAIRLIQGPVITSVIPDVICSADSPIQMNSIPTNTEWFGLDGSSILDPMLFNGGYVVCEFNDATGRMCSSLRGPLQRWNSLPAEITPIGPFCPDSPVQNVTAAAAPPFNVTWSGDISGSAATGFTFDPAQGPGAYTIILDVEAFAPNQCRNSDTLVINVGEYPSITFTPFPAYCATGVPIPLSGALPEGGFWSGAGVADGALDPAIVGEGNHLVSYFATTTLGCSAQLATSIPLFPSASIEWPSEDLVLCTTDPILDLGAEPTGGEWIGPVNTEGQFDPAIADLGENEIGYSYTDPRGCVLSAAPVICSLFASEVVIIEEVLGQVCTSTPPFPLVGSADGSWSGSVQGNGQTVLFDPAQLGQGTWTVTLTVGADSACPGVATQVIVVDICTGVEEQALLGTVLAPNPFTGSLALFTSGNGQAAIDVLDAAGRCLLSKTTTLLGRTQLDLDLNGQPPGSYTVRVTSAGRVQHLRAVKAN